jgi:CDP-diacylglycerol---glycerol-3-phosphate 3-phosphatidyltransferase
MSSFPWLSVVPLAAIFLAFWVGLAVFALRVRRYGRPQSARLEQQGESVLLSSFAAAYGLWFLSLPVRACIRLRIHPDALTWMGLVLSIGAAIAVGGGHFGLGGWLFMVGAMLDAIDGMVARERGLAGDSGGFLDSVLDRVSDMAIFFGLIFYYRDRALAAVLCAAALTASTLISYMRAKAGSMGLEPPRVMLRRPERVVYLGCSLALSPILAALVERQDPHPWNHLALLGVALIAVLGTAGVVRTLTVVRRRLSSRTRAEQDAAPTAP